VRGEAACRNPPTRITAFMPWRMRYRLSTDNLPTQDLISRHRPPIIQNIPQSLLLRNLRPPCRRARTSRDCIQGLGCRTGAYVPGPRALQPVGLAHGHQRVQHPLDRKALLAAIIIRPRQARPALLPRRREPCHVHPVKSPPGFEAAYGDDGFLLPRLYRCHLPGKRRCDEVLCLAGTDMY